MIGRGARLALVALFGVGLTLAYANHFRNEFHFDDVHTITDNAAIRSLANLPAFFSDSRTFSTLATHQVYRPLLTASLALDYHLAGGGEPFVFQLTTFLWFFVLLFAIYVLAASVYRRAAPDADPFWPAILCTATFGFHPVAAETLNYVIQRAELYSALGVVGSLALYAASPRARRFGLYLLPVAAGALAKPPTLIFVAMLGVYVALFEPAPRGRWRRVAVAIGPALALSVVLGYLLARMTGPGFEPGGGPALEYRLTQLHVSWQYFASFFAPIHLSADSDTRLVAGLADRRVALGAAFVVAMLVAAVIAARRPRGKPVAFGILWFFLGLLPTSLMPLAEAANDHRMFLPFVGLAVAVVWVVWLAAGGRLASPNARAALAFAAGAILMLEAVGTFARNGVWRSDETLWLDVTQKSPGNGRGWMNYGLTQMQKGDYRTALDCFEKASRLTPNYSNLEINLGVVKAATGRHGEAEPHFLRALQLAPGQAKPHYFYARWLKERGRLPEALAHLNQAAENSPSDQPTRELLAEVTGLLRTSEESIPADEAMVRDTPTPEGWLDVSLRYYRRGRFADCLRAAREALVLRPGYAEAYNNVAAAHNALKQWDEAIVAAEMALVLRPDFELARNNLMFAKASQRPAR